MRAATTRAAPGVLERRFALRARGTTLRTELLGGVATFLTMS
jgi:adenine/guanine/hypoxanthine permease